MPGFEMIGEEEKKALIEIFEKSRGVLFAHGFDTKRKGIFRVREFERRFSEKFHVPYAQALSSGTAALKTALKALGVDAGDEVITQAFTFIATVEAIIDCGATPIIVDIDESLNMSPGALKKAISNRTKAVIPVHMLGVAAEMDAIVSICKAHNIFVIEDNAQSCGGTYKDSFLGTIGDMGCFSFDFGKSMTCGEGGMLVTNSEEYYAKGRSYHDHGHEYSKTTSRGCEGAVMPGFNFRMTEMQAAIGMVQLEKLGYIVERQRSNKKLMKEYLSGRRGGLHIEFRKILDEKGDAGDALVFFVESKNRALAIADRLSKNGIGTKNLPDSMRWHFAGEWGHIFKDNSYYSSDWKNRWNVSRQLLEQAIALPVFVKAEADKIRKDMDIVIKVLEETSKESVSAK